jgi:hypothetical protein
MLTGMKFEHTESLNNEDLAEAARQTPSFKDLW